MSTTTNIITELQHNVAVYQGLVEQYKSLANGRFWADMRTVPAGQVVRKVEPIADSNSTKQWVA